jgi:hypothetical protein
MQVYRKDRVEVATKQKILLNDQLIEITHDQGVRRTWLAKRLFEIPYLPDNPLFVTEYRHIRWPRTIHDMKFYALLLTALATCITIFLVVVDLKVFGRSAMIVLLNTTLIGTLVLALSGDVLLLQRQSSRIARQIEAGQWEAMQLTALTAQRVYAAKIAIGQLRARRLMLALTILRILPLIAILLLVVLDAFDQGFFLSRFYRTWLTEGHAIIIIGLILIPLLFYFCFLEPYWQLYTVAALGVLIPLLVRNVLFSALTGVIVLFLLRIVQVFLLGIGLFLFFFLASLRSPLTFCFWSPAFVLGWPISLVVFHRAVRHFSEVWAEKLIFCH